MGASIEGTRRYFERTSRPVSPVILGKTGWNASPFGFGCYRVGTVDPTHAAALEAALLGGCNLIDTSTNYGDGDSESLVGRTLDKLIGSEKIKRDEIIIVTKAGYVQGTNLQLAKKNPFPDIVEYHPECWHCIHPEFLEDQITRSLQRLGVDQIDVLLLHNPEYFLKTEPNHAEYYRRIDLALKHLASEVKRGRIQHYGISSNSFPSPRESGEFTSIEMILKNSASSGSADRFSVIQFPFNAFEPGAALEINNSGASLLQFAKANQLATLINRPLNAFVANELIRLADFPDHPDRDVEAEMIAAFQKATEHEQAYLWDEVFPTHQIAWAHILRKNLPLLNELEYWKQLVRHRIRPTFQLGQDALGNHSPEAAKWLGPHLENCESLISAVTRYLEFEQSYRSMQVTSNLLRNAPALARVPSLSQKVLTLYRSIPGVDCILVGMRTPEYVQNVMKPFEPLAPEVALKALEQLQSLIPDEETQTQ